MGLFDFFTKSDDGKDKRSFQRFYDSKQTDTPIDRGPVKVCSPKSFKDVETIITRLKEGGQVILNLKELDTKTAYRVLDMVCGAVFALNGGIYEIENNIFMLSPSGID